MLFVPRADELAENNKYCYCIIFIKPYSFRVINSFMRLYGYSAARLVETPSYYVYYQEGSKLEGLYPLFVDIASDEVVMDLIKKLSEQITLKYLMFFDEKVIMVTYKEPFIVLFSTLLA